MKFLIDAGERVATSFVVTYIGAVTVLPGGLFAAHNWQIALAASVGSTVKALLARHVGDPNSASLAPQVAAGAAGGAVGAAAGAAVGETVGGVVGGVGAAVEDIVKGVTGDQGDSK